MNALVTLRPRGCPPGIEPRRWQEVLAARIEAQTLVIDRLLAATDAMDYDPDLEPDLGAPESAPFGFRRVGGEYPSNTGSQAD